MIEYLVDILIEWLNFVFLVLSTILFLYFYVKSASPAQLEKTMGEKAWPRCKTYRLLASAFESITIVNYILYIFYPLPLGLPLTLPWDYWISIFLSILILIPCGYLMFRGMRDAGEETIEPKKDHTLYTGIYDTIRHPQAIGESFLWFPFALWFNSPFLVIYSFVWIPVIYIMCLAEERDLVIRYGQSYLDYRNRVGFLIPKRNRE
jgi:protein-S-isoprenylcysteine O-methyltransferase Ste14